MKKFFPRILSLTLLWAVAVLAPSCSGDIYSLDGDGDPATRAAGDYELLIWPYDADWLTGSGIFDFTATTTDPNVMGRGTFEWDAFNGIVLIESRNNASIYFPAYESVREVSVRAYYDGEYSEWTRIGNREQLPVFSADIPTEFILGNYINRIPIRVTADPADKAAEYYYIQKAIQNGVQISEGKGQVGSEILVSSIFTESGLGEIIIDIHRHSDDVLVETISGEVKLIKYPGFTMLIPEEITQLDRVRFQIISDDLIPIGVYRYEWSITQNGWYIFDSKTSEPSLTTTIDAIGEVLVNCKIVNIETEAEITQLSSSVTVKPLDMEFSVDFPTGYGATWLGSLDLNYSPSRILGYYYAKWTMDVDGKILESQQLELNETFRFGVPERGTQITITCDIIHKRTFTRVESISDSKRITHW